MITDFENKVVVITGAASGIGLALAQSFAVRKAKLTLADINKPKLEQLAVKLKADGSEVLTFAFDVSDAQSFQTMADQIYDAYGAVHILCNNAGVTLVGPEHMLSTKDYKWVLSVNFIGVVSGVKAFLPRMLQTDEPCHIVNTASIAGLVPGGSGGPYTASKFAIIGYTEFLMSQYFSTNVKFSVLCPGAVRTDINKNSQTLGKDRSKMFTAENRDTPEFRAVIEGAERIIEAGIAPESVSEKVIAAISQDIFYIITHPAYLPIIEARSHAIAQDHHLLFNEKDFQWGGLSGGNKFSKYQHESPEFSVLYPLSWKSVPLPPNSPLKLMVSCPEYVISVLIIDLPPQVEHEDIIHINAHMLGAVGNHVKILANKKSTLKDGTTTAYEGKLEYRANGLAKTYILNLSAIKDKKVVSVNISYYPNHFSESLRDLLYSLEF